MVRVPGSLGASGYHRESPDEEAQAGIGLGNEASTGIGSPSTSLKSRSIHRSAEFWEELYRRNRGSPPAKAGNVSAKQPPSSISIVKKKPARSKSSRKKLKAPDSDVDDRIDLTSAWTNEQLESVYHKKQLHAFLAEDAVMRILRPKLLGDLKGPVSEPALRSNKLDNVKATEEVIKAVPKTLFELLKPLVDGVHTISKNGGSPCDSPRDDHDVSSSHYESATEEVDTDSVDDPPRTTLGPSGTAMLRDRAA
ncbi:hypothetical protein PPTG_20493 [Phytophthora nicotianae INRA-310]|uniref:Uncharacterized protein n=1 Tax=Phytophthora nicotianae (strain INRA-310) TaxID=761204 RepID=W2P8H9_PHYN3|nr:hypothetical protein PPTG_20493 [Phytophthora nicotianae INRA-310]ETM97151.1 hypothetical protein PPTG_20493 [Phytophthora nicotianae INRA-310]